MAYDTQDLERTLLAILKRNQIITTIKDTCAYGNISRETFYSHNLDKSNKIKDQIFKNKTYVKASLRKKMFNSSNPSAWKDLYKLLGDDEELNRLTYNKQDVNLGGQKDNPVQIVDFSNYVPPNKERDAIIKRITGGGHPDEARGKEEKN